ncbi:MAG TPA: antitermination protein NusG [Clostridiales bacterium]|nr:antitermination protein NusG [Clostridiales bacterium]
MSIYILFVITNQEQKVIDAITKQFHNKEHFCPFIPRRVTFFKRSGQVPRKEKLIMFPGYVFIKSELCDINFFQQISPFVRTNKDVIRVLRYGDSNEYAVREDECNKLIDLLNDDYCIETSAAFLEGDRVKIIEGPLKGKESIIKKVKRSRMEAVIHLEIMGEERPITLGIDILQKI